MGMSAESCHKGGGSFFRSPCITLYQCIDARPREIDPGFNQVFEEWVVAGDIDIYDPYEEEQCAIARSELGYNEDYANDYEVCKTFNELMCDPFFDDIEFLSGDGSSDDAVQFEQVDYIPIE